MKTRSIVSSVLFISLFTLAGCSRKEPNVPSVEVVKQTTDEPVFNHNNALVKKTDKMIDDVKKSTSEAYDDAKKAASQAYDETKKYIIKKINEEKESKKDCN